MRMKLVQFRDEMFQQYKNKIKGCEHISLLEAEKKMSRNMILAHKPDSTGYKGQMYQYGSLWFVVVRNRITWLRNHCDVPEGWTLDIEEYRRLNKELGIKEDNKCYKLDSKQEDTYIILTKKRKVMQFFKEKYQQLIAQ